MQKYDSFCVMQNNWGNNCINFCKKAIFVGMQVKKQAKKKYKLPDSKKRRAPKRERANIRFRAAQDRRGWALHFFVGKPYLTATFTPLTT